MMKPTMYRLIFAGVLLVLAAVLFGLHLAVFREPRHDAYYFFYDLAFIPIQILVVTLIIERLIDDRERQARMKKMSMVFGTFFSEVGIALLKMLSSYDTTVQAFQQDVRVTPSWTERQFRQARRAAEQAPGVLLAQPSQLRELKTFLMARRPFVLSLMGNPNLLEHESFTDLLWAIFHLTDELVYRTDVDALPPSDVDHLAGDMKRAYKTLVVEWIKHLHHLKKDYPYLFSLAVRTNPFDPTMSVVVA